MAVSSPGWAERGQACSARPPKPVRCELQSRRQRGKLSLLDWQRKDLSVWVLSSPQVFLVTWVPAVFWVLQQNQTSPVPAWSALESAFPGSNLLRVRKLPDVTFVEASLETPAGIPKSYMGVRGAGSAISYQSPLVVALRMSHKSH